MPFPHFPDLHEKSEGGFGMGFWGKRVTCHVGVAGAVGIFVQIPEVSELDIALLRLVFCCFVGVRAVVRDSSGLSCP
jgi:hypothetical protein